jgi:hypothetical protein
MPLVTVAVQMAVPGVVDSASNKDMVPDAGTTLPLGAPKNAGVTVELKTTGTPTLGELGKEEVIFAVVPEGLTVWVAVVTVPRVKLRSGV